MFADPARSRRLPALLKASAWPRGRVITETELRRDLAALQLRDQFQAAKPGSLTEDEAMDLVNEAKRATRKR